MTRDPRYPLRALGALALLAVGAVHIDQYVSVHYKVVPVIGTLFLANLITAATIALVLLLPAERVLGTTTVALAALAGITLAATSGAFLLVSEHTTLFGFAEHGYRTAILLALIAEGATVTLLGAYLATLASRRRDPPAR